MGAIVVANLAIPVIQVMRHDYRQNGAFNRNDLGWQSRIKSDSFANGKQDTRRPLWPEFSPLPSEKFPASRTLYRC